MKKHLLMMLMPVVSISLTSCGQVMKYAEHLEDYIFTMQYHDNFNILQLTDIHWNFNSSTMASKRYMDKVLKEADRHMKETQGNAAKIDLVEITGDIFMLANSFHVESFVQYFEEKAKEFNFMYTVIWGNHDRHGLYNANWLGEKFARAEHCYYFEPNDDLYGRSNFIINLTEDGSENSATKWQIVNLDSGASFSETAISPFRDYDYIRKDQTDWWLKEHNLVGDAVPTVAYYHIPQDENLKAWKAKDTLTHKYFKLEGFADNGNEEYERDFIDVAKQHNLKAAFMGHAHNVDWTVLYEGVLLGLGVKTGPELYYAHIKTDSADPDMQEGLASVGINENFDLIGASMFTLTDTTGAYELDHLYLNERESNDFVRWVKW